MGLLLSKILTYLAMPLGTALLLAVLALFSLLAGRARLASGLALAGLSWVGLWATPAFSEAVRESLESGYPPVSAESLPRADVIVVLGGGIGVAFPPRLYPDLGDASDRVWHAARLYHAGRAPRLILSGGMLPWKSGAMSEAEAMAVFLRALGVPQDRMQLESESATTRDNALETARMMADTGAQGAILVTSALHMRRAESSFRALGIEVVPAATDHEVVKDGPLTALDLLPDAGALEASSRALKEMLGLVVYRLRGWAA